MSGRERERKDGTGRRKRDITGMERQKRQRACPGKARDPWVENEDCWAGEAV